MYRMGVSARVLTIAGAALASACGSDVNTPRDDGSAPGGAATVSPGVWTPPAEVEPGSPVAEHGALRVEGTQLMDADGAPVQLKGVSTMWLNWESQFADSKAGLKWMRDNWGLTVIRAAMGIEPQGAFLQNPSLAKARLRTVVQNAIDLGVYVIVDWHDHNAHLHLDQSVAFFSEIATDFGSFPNVIYEPYNEPLLTDSAGTTVTWSGIIKPYHEGVLAAIRSIDPDNVVVLGNRQWDQRPDEAALDPVAGTNLMYSVHFYSCTHGASLRAFAQSAFGRGLPLFASEWGATNADGGKDGMVCVPEAQAWHDWLNQAGISWTAWRLQTCTNEASCLFSSNGVRPDGNWTDDVLTGHGPIVVELLRAPPAVPAPR
jgi:endoglucanase